MVYGADRIVQMPVMQLYDTGLMQSAINNARYMYEKAEKRMDDFYDKYGDFITPIQKDQDWYNENVTGRFRQGIDDLYARGIDPLRSAVGRAELAKLARSIDVGSVAKLKSSAKAAEEYIKNRGLLEAQGKYNQDLEQRFLRYDLNNWSTLGNGTWNRTAPAEMKSLKELTESWYNQRTPHTLDKAGVESFGMKYDPRYDYTGFTAGDLLNIASGQTPGWNGTVYADYYRSLAKDKLQRAGIDNPDAKQIEQQLQKDVATANVEYLINPSMSVNPLYLQELKNRQARALAAARHGNGNQNPQQEAPTTFMDRLQQNMSANFENKRFGRETYANTFNSIINYWDKMAKSFEPNGKVTGTEKYKENKQVVENGFVPGMASFWRTRTGTKVEEKERPVRDQKNNASYNKAMYEKSRWSNFSNGNYYPSRYDTRKTSDGKYIVQVINNIIKKGKDATPQEMAMLQAYQQEDIQSMMMKSQSSSPEWSTGSGKRGQMSTADAKKRASDFWDTFSAEGLGSIQNKVLHQQFVGATGGIKDPDLSNGYYSVRFGSGYHYAPVRQLGISGNAKFRHNDIHRKFDRFLQGKTGISISENDVKAAGIPSGNIMGRQLDILSHPLMTSSQIKQFFNSLSDEDRRKYKSVDGLCKELGLMPVEQKITYRDKNNNVHDTDTYYEVPVIRTIENLGGQNFRDINALSDIIEFNAGVADKNIMNSENQSYMDALPIELATQMIQQ